MTDKDPLFDRFFDSMESLADAISESLQSQVTIEDSNHHVIGYSSHEFESDSARISTIIGKRVPNAVIIGLRKKGLCSSWRARHIPFEFLRCWRWDLVPGWPFVSNIRRKFSGTYG